MFYLFFIFHLLIYVVVALLFKKRLRRTGMILGVINSFFFLLNSLVLSKTLLIEYSSILYLREEIKNHVIVNLLWIMMNFLSFFYLIQLLKKKVIKYYPFLKTILSLFISVMITFLLSFIFANQASYLFFFLILYWLSISIKDFIQKKKNYYLVSVLLLIIILVSSYFSDLGSAKFAIAIAGYPKIAYETGFEELKYFEEKNIKKYSPIETIPLKEGTVGIIEVKKVLFLRFSSLYKA